MEECISKYLCQRIYANKFPNLLDMIFNEIHVFLAYQRVMKSYRRGMLSMYNITV